MAARIDRIMRLDRRLYLLLHSRIRFGWLDPAMVRLTNAGTKGVVWLLIAGFLLLLGTAHARLAAVLSVAALLVAEGAVNLVLKPLVRRERPFKRKGLKRLLVNAPGPHSWPSAHAASSAAAALVLSLAFPEWAVPIMFLAVLIAYSRVYVGVHYPLDVLAGMVVGTVAAIAVLLAALPVANLGHAAL